MKKVRFNLSIKEEAARKVRLLSELTGKSVDEVMEELIEGKGEGEPKKSFLEAVRALPEPKQPIPNKTAKEWMQEYVDEKYGRG